MGSNTKKTKETRKRRHRSRSHSFEEKEAPKEKKHRHHRKHKEKRREKHKHEYESDDSDVIEVIPNDESQMSPPPAPEISNSVESLSIKETNKLRAKLGLKPLQVQDSSKNKADDGKKKDDLGEFYHKPAHSLTEKNQQEKIRSKLADHREKRNIDSKLSKVKLLSSQDSDDDDAVAWVEKNRRINNAKKEAERRAKMLEELDAQFGIGEIVESEQKHKREQRYNEKSLRGLKVNHDMDTFGERAVILTLEDKDVLEEGEDVLINVNMRENEKYQRSNENKKRKADHDDEEVDQYGNLKPKSLLGKYDEEIEGEKKDSFQIGIDNAVAYKQAMLQNIRNKLANKIVENLGTTQLTIASDYYNEEEMSKFKKPKKKIRKTRVKGNLLTADALERSVEASTSKHSGKMHIEREHLSFDDVPAIKTEIKLEDEVDDSLERALQKSRRLKQKRKVTSAMAIADVIKPEITEDTPELGNIVLNATAEFCRTLGDIPTYGKSGNREDSENLEELQNEDSDDVEIIEEEEVDEGGKWNAVDPNKIAKESSKVTIVETPILDEEPDVSSGVGAALKLAMSKGYLDKEENNRPSNSRLAHLQAQHYSIEDKTYGDELERGGGNRRERYTGPITDFKEKDMFKPNVKLEYIDDEGHVLSAKEAFRYLSHKFHGKGPGKNKVEKRLKKSQQEGLMKKMSSTDTPLGTLNMLQSKQKEMQSPYIVLSGGKHTHSTTIAKARR
ncbi:hypothetical protein FQR65_LT06166 [Abscondita terminalis]|nr:hypothetical protein FQR65_LT06166 [Abscondita terminalis]